MLNLWFMIYFKVILRQGYMVFKEKIKQIYIIMTLAEKSSGTETETTYLSPTPRPLA